MSIVPAPSRFAYFSLCCVGLMWVFPFLHYTHQYPLTTFYQEWWTVLFAVLAALLLLGKQYWQAATVPRVVILPLALLVVLLLQYSLSKIIYYQHAMLWALYLLLMAVLMILGAQLRQQLGLLRLATGLAFFLLLGAELSALAALQQHFMLDTPLKHWVVVKLGAGVYGNMGQPNHFANYVSLGLVSLGLLYQLRRVPSWLVVLLASPLLLTLTLSGSRSVFIYLAFLVLLAVWQYRKDVVFKPLLRYAVTALLVFVLLQWLVAQPWLAGVGPQGATSASERLLQQAHNESIRAYLWREAWWMFLQAPWLGVGIGQFGWQHFLLLPELQANHIRGFYNNAHNLPLQFAAETGLSGLTILLVATLIWLRGQRTSAMVVSPDLGEQAARWWGLALLGVLLIHSQLEYPLWYAYFLAIFAFVLGMLDLTRYTLRMQGLGRFSMMCVWLIGVLVLVQLRRDYVQLEQLVAPANRQQLTQGQGVAQVAAVLDRLQASALLSPYAEWLIASTLTLEPSYLEQKIALNQRVMQHAPMGSSVYRQVLLLALAGQQSEARQLVLPGLWSYPAEFATFKQNLVLLAQKHPEQFSALLEFALQKEQEYLRAVSD